MKLEPIDIDIKISNKETRNKYFSDVSLIFDQDNFIKWVHVARDRLGMEKALNKEQGAWYLDSLNKDIAKEELFNDIVAKILDKFWLNRLYKTAVEQAIVCNLVTEKDYAPAIMHYEYDEFNKGNDLVPIGIITFAPGVRDDDVTNLLSEYRRNLKGKKGEGYEYEPPSSRLGIRGLNAIIKHRDIYVLYQFKDKTYEEIKEKYPDYDNTDIKKAIEGYKGHLGGK